MVEKIKKMQIQKLRAMALLLLFALYFKVNAQPNVTITQNSTPPSKTNPNASPNETPTPSTNQIIPLTTQEQPQINTSNQGEKESGEEAKDDENIYLNFENATLTSVVNYLAEEKKINIIPRSDLDGISVSLTTRAPMTLERAWNVLLTLLEMNNFTIINVNNLYRIVPKAENKQEPLPIYSSGTGTQPKDLPDNDLVIRYIYFLKNIKAQTVQGFLATMIEGDVQVNSDLDVCIITDKSLHIKTALNIIEELDTGGLRESIKIVPLKHADATDISTLFLKVIPKAEQKSIRFIGPSSKKQAAYFSTDVKIIPDSRKNSLILLGTEKSSNRIIDFIYKYLDVPIRAAESRLHIKEIKYAKAESLSPILSSIIKPPSGDKAVVGEYKFFEDVIIASDSSGNQGGGNRLIIASNKEDWERLEKIIDRLDKPQPQVAFEVMIVDVSITKDHDLWTQFKPKKTDMIGSGINFQFNTFQNNEPGKNNISIPTGEASKVISTNMTFGAAPNLWGIVHAILKKQNFNIITQPFLVSNNNQKTEIDSRDTRQVEGELRTSVGTDPVREKISKDASTKVSLTPKVNLNGTVDLDITVYINAFQGTTQTNPNTTDRSLTTRVNIGSGEVLILGGLTRSTLSEKHYKVPILGSIPILGNIFRSKTKSKEKSNLYIFIRPSIIKPRFEGVPDEYTQLKLDYAKYQILNVDTYAREKDPIQRWFFKPSKQTAKQKIEDAKRGIFKPIDKFTYGAKQPKSVNVSRDPYFRASETIEDVKEEAKNNTQTLAFTKTIKPQKSKGKVRRRKLKRRSRLA